ncbi:MAG TPA: phage tail sheath C-terminal domain-containing protein [Thermoanaerobaculia bacterium]|nr:phage tail sheath C-terminal domain-containing protein [Thermoanaerobaculia bacterium]
MIASPVFGAPGVYVAPERTVPALAGVRLDVCGFVGVAPRGPARVPDASPDPLPAGSTLGLPRRRSAAVPVESFAEYRRLYGGFEGPGRLPFAVAAFFEQGGRRAWVVRVVHAYGGAVQDEGGVARGVLGGVEVAGALAPVTLLARDEGIWGNRLRAAIGFASRPLPFVAAGAASIDLDPADRVPPGTLLRCAFPGGEKAWASVAGFGRLEAEGTLRAALDRVLDEAPVSVEVVEGTLVVDDGAGFVERHVGLGLSPLHPRWMAAVLCHESDLVYPDVSWHEENLVPVGLLEDGARFGDPVLPAAEPREPELPQFSGGEDRFQDLVPEDFFDAGWTLGDERPGSGVHALVGLPEIASVVVPDLYCPEPLEPFEVVVGEVSLATAEFAPCDDFVPPAEVQAAPPPGLDGLCLDPNVDFDQIVGLQARLIDLAEVTGGFVALIDVPPGLSPSRVRAWRSRFRSSWVAAYHPWLRVARPDDGRDGLILLPPSAVAAGAIARSELVSGVPQGPWGGVAAGVLAVAEPVPPALHAELHPMGINVFQPERDGVVLWGGRTLSRDPQWRQVSVRRLAMLLRRTLERETQWLVFEPNGPALWAEIRTLLRVFLRRLYLQGAFAGAGEEQAFFVRCDATTTPARLQDQGQVVVEVGFAPSEPLEFIVLRVVRGGDGTLTVEE